MKIYEIVIETQEVNEFIGTARKAYQAYQRSKDLKAANAARRARQAKNIFGQSKYSLKGLKGQARIDMVAKRAAASASAAAKAKNSIGSITNLSAILQALGAGAIVYDYLTQISSVEEDFEEFKAAAAEEKSVSNTDNMFAEYSSVKDARAHALEIREELLGYASAQILAITGLSGKFVSVLGSALKVIPVFGPIIGYPMKGLGWVLTKLGGGNSATATSVRIALTAWISSPQGIEFIRKWSDGILIALGGMVTDWLGKGVAFAIDSMIELGDAAAEWISQKTGLAIKVPDAVKSKLTPSKAEKDAEAGGIKVSGPTINGIRITDKDGFLRSDNDFYNNFKIQIAVDQALRQGKPNPLDQAKRKPGVNYPTFNMTTGRFDY